MTEHECANCGGECGSQCDDCTARNCPDCEEAVTGKGLCPACIATEGVNDAE